MKRICVFKVNQLGDNVVFLPVIQWLASQPEVAILLYTTPTAARLYSNLPPSVAVTTIERDAFLGMWKSPWRLLRELVRLWRFSPHATLLGEDQGNTAHLLSALSLARVRVGSKRPFIKIPGGVNRDINCGSDVNHAMWGWQLLRGLADELSLANPPATPPPPDLRPMIRKVPRSHIVIHAGGSHAYRRWDVAHFATVAKRLARDYDVRWIKTGAPEPVRLDPGITVVETRMIDDLVSEIGNTHVFLGNSSGPMHIAQAVGTPSVILLGPSSRNWNPYWHTDRHLILRDESLPCICCEGVPGHPNRCTNLENPLACMKFWTPEVVEIRCREWLEKFCC